jgi:hypothetical protein
LNANEQLQREDMGDLIVINEATGKHTKTATYWRKVKSRVGYAHQFLYKNGNSNFLIRNSLFNIRHSPTSLIR